MSPSIDKYLPILYDIIKQINKVFAVKCGHFFLNYNKCKTTTLETLHKLYIEYNGEEIAYIKFTIHRNETGIQIHLASFTNKLYQRRRYNLLLRTVLTCFGCIIKKTGAIKGTFDLYSAATSDVIILHSILKYFQPRILYSAPTKQTIDKRADITLLQTIVEDVHVLKSLGALDIYVPLDAENANFAELLLKRLLGGNSDGLGLGLIYPESVIAMDG